MSGYRQCHAGGRAAVALHYALAHAGAWSGLAAALPQLALTAPDLPGHGDSPLVAQDLDEAVSAMTGLLARQVPGGPLVLVGHSFGAALAVRVVPLPGGSTLVGFSGPALDAVPRDPQQADSIAPAAEPARMAQVASA